MTRTYTYTVEGTGRGGATWRTDGTVDNVQPGDFPVVVTHALRESFARLTEGRAVYGDLTTCQGPYAVHKLTIELIPDLTIC